MKVKAATVKAERASVMKVTVQAAVMKVVGVEGKGGGDGES